MGMLGAGNLGGISQTWFRRFQGDLRDNDGGIVVGREWISA